MARQWGRVQPEQSDIFLALNVATIATIAKDGFSRASIEEMQLLTKKRRAEVWEEKMRGVVFPRQNKVKAAKERHPAMVYKYHTDGHLPCQNGTAKNLQTSWRHKGTGSAPPEPAAPLAGTPPPPRMPPVASGDTDWNESYEIEGMPSRWVYIHSPHSNTQFCNHNAYAKDSKRDKDFIPNLLSTLSAAWQFCWQWFWRWQQPF